MQISQNQCALGMVCQESVVVKPGGSCCSDKLPSHSNHKYHCIQTEYFNIIEKNITPMIPSTLYLQLKLIFNRTSQTFIFQTPLVCSMYFPWNIIGQENYIPLVAVRWWCSTYFAAERSCLSHPPSFIFKAV